MSSLLDSFLDDLITKGVEGKRFDVEATLAEVKALDPETYKALEGGVVKLTADMAWCPNPGPQTDAYNCEADELLYGGEVGGGKTDIGIGLALQKHKRSLILRRQGKEVEPLVQRAVEIIGHKDGYNGSTHMWSFPDGRVIQFGGAQHLGDERGYKGHPKDLLVFDEASEFLESQVRFLKLWLRTKDPKQKTKLLLPTNPPDSVTGAWIVTWFGPWVDPRHPLYPVADGKLLYFREHGPEEIEWREEPWTWLNHKGKAVRSLSRTFIRSTLDDNPDYARTDYASRIDAAPEELKARYGRGEFVVDSKDDEWQVIPTAWVREAQARWKPEGRSTLMTSMGCDVARGGPDQSTIARRHGAWVDEMVAEPGEKTPDGPSLAALIILYRRNNAAIRIDAGGGWGGSPLDMLKSNTIEAVGVNPASGSQARTADLAKLAFRNMRAEMWWRLREALDPDRPNPLALPPDQKLLADLVAPRWSLTSGGILIEDKKETRKRLGRSPDRGDAVALTCTASNNPIEMARSMGLKGRPVSELPKQANLGYSKFKARYRTNRSPR